MYGEIYELKEKKKFEYISKVFNDEKPNYEEFHNPNISHLKSKIKSERNQQIYDEINRQYSLFPTKIIE
jgi:hypothetical protein